MADDKELKDQRVPIMMTASELEAIDDWMFKNRIRSRGEAIRRLCRMGVETDEFAGRLLETVEPLNAASFDVMKLLRRLNDGEPPDPEDIRFAEDKLLDVVRKVTDLNSDVHEKLGPYRVAGGYEELQAALREQQRILDEIKSRQSTLFDAFSDDKTQMPDE